MTVQAMTRFFGFLTIAAQLGTLGIVGVVVASRWSGPLGARARALRTQLGTNALGLAWLVATVATAGSLYLSEVAHFKPCVLCWYQRIAMYPLSAVLAVAALRRDRGIWRYLLPLSLVGGTISIYHYQLERFPSQATVGCDVEAPCTLVWVWLFHYISIPMMALSAFAFITALVLVARHKEPT